MTAPFPHTYDVALTWKSGPTGTLLAAPRPPLVVGKPPQFDGGAGWWSPEHLLLGSVASCFMATYLSLAERQKVLVQSFRCEASGELDRTEEGFRFVAVRLAASVDAPPEHRERAERLLESARRYCVVSNSLRAPVTLELSGRTPA